MQNETNQYKVAAQAKKVMAMVEAIDKAALNSKPTIHPFRNAGQILLALNGYSEANWNIVDKIAKLKTKSSWETRDMVINIYKDRTDQLFL